MLAYHPNLHENDLIFAIKDMAYGKEHEIGRCAWTSCQAIFLDSRAKTLSFPHMDYMKHSIPKWFRKIYTCVVSFLYFFRNFMERSVLFLIIKDENLSRMWLMSQIISCYEIANKLHWIAFRHLCLNGMRKEYILPYHV